MALPEFTPTGDLPEGVHQATLAEVVARFEGTSPLRQRATQNLTRLCTLVRATGQLHRLVVFGSYVTAKIHPNDIDVILVMQDGFDPNLFDGEVKSIFDRQTANNKWRASIFWLCSSSVLLGSLDEFIASWQLKRDLALRGIVEVIA